MLQDLRQLEDGQPLRADVCVVGSGPAGTVVANELRKTGHDVVLLESGGVHADAATQDLYRGSTSGHPYAPLHGVRLRYLGGTSNHWTGYVRKLRAQDFEPRPGMPDSGWPIGIDDLQPYFDRAKAFLGLGKASLNGEDWVDDLELPFLDFDRSKVRHGCALVRPMRFGRFAQETFGKSQRVRLYTHANLNRIELRRDGNAVDRLSVQTLDGQKHNVRARYYVLACGGIENARLLLASNNVEAAGVGNHRDCVGRYFMEHPYVNNFGHLYSEPDTARDLVHVYGSRHEVREGVEVYPQIETSESFKQAAGTHGALVKIRRASRARPGLRAIRQLRDMLTDAELRDDPLDDLSDAVVHFDDIAIRGAHRLFGERPVNMLTVTGEQRPSASSRVSLDASDRDALGMPRVHLAWNLSNEDYESMETSTREVALELGRLDVARVRSPVFEPDDAWRESVTWSYHHLGTTRMGEDPATSVVDADCRVHGKPNLYVAGSSVFPTGGTATPTFTIIALAMRIADHITHELSRKAPDA